MDTLKDFLVSLQSSKDAGGIGGTVDPLLQFHLIADFMYEFAFQWDDRAAECLKNHFQSHFRHKRKKFDFLRH